METEEFLTGGYTILQDGGRYRFTSDSILLARFVKAKKGENVADFCAGSGVVGLHFYAENRGVEHVTLFEADSGLSAMSKRSVARNGLEDKFTAVCGRVQEISHPYLEKFSLILCNPPYERDGFSRRVDPGCSMELTLTLAELLSAAARTLKFGGRFVVIHRADRVAELLSGMRMNGLEPKKLQFVAGKEGRKPYAVLVAAAKGAHTGVDVLPTHINGTEPL